MPDEHGSRRIEHAGWRIEIVDHLAFGLQQFGGSDLAWIARQLALLGVDQTLAVLAEIEFVQRCAGRNRLTRHHLGDAPYCASITPASARVRSRCCEE
ncbi:hypothetical protein [Candidatus Accumulibacter sp. ACC012]|uniref:hypothetical protein n=1 Tax=Candidatus Accumulibacter sp. ACC012 TaxID=2823332 RepID=UPI0025C3955F|nr:hypothetical protein [Candidatus Accumulibacter sp. ACC012]